MKEVALAASPLPQSSSSFIACVATILELPVETLPDLAPDKDPARSWTLSRWLGGLGLGLVPVADARSFSWAGPWIARIRPRRGDRRCVVMYGVPSGVVWDPSETALSVRTGSKTDS